MQKRVVLVSAAVAVLGAAATVLGFAAENTKSNAFVRFDGQRCVYRRTPALVYGVAAALLALAALAIATAASGCLRRRGAPAPPFCRRRVVAVRLSSIAWLVVAVAVVFFLYGAAMNRGGTRGLSESWRGRRYGPGGYYYGCTVLRSGVFTTAAVLSAIATAFAVVGYVCFQRTDVPPPPPPPPGQFVAPPPGVAMGQPQWAQPYPPPPMAYPAPPPQYGHGGYGPNKQPAGTA